MTIRDLSQFRAGGFDDEGGEPTEPVTVTCGSCGERSPWFTYRDDGGADRTAPLGDLVAWALAHDCGGLRACSRRGDRVAYLSSRDMCDGCEEEQ